MWCIPPGQSAEFVCAMETVLDVYRRPYDSDFPLVCMDETSKQLVGEMCRFSGNVTRLVALKRRAGY